MLSKDEKDKIKLFLKGLDVGVESLREIMGEPKDGPDRFSDLPLYTAIRDNLGYIAWRGDGGVLTASEHSPGRIFVDAMPASRYDKTGFTVLGPVLPALLAAYLKTAEPPTDLKEGDEVLVRAVVVDSNPDVDGDVLVSYARDGKDDSTTFAHPSSIIRL